jgi:nucleoside-diphosphate-sugar epimerase
MKVFVTGSTGNIGTSLVKDLLAHGHTVLGLTRSHAGTEKLTALGATPLYGTLSDLLLLAQAARESDAVAHLAFNHDFSDFANSCAADQAAISAMGEALVGSGKPLLVTSGTMGMVKGKLAYEKDERDAKDPLVQLRGASEDITLSFANKGVRASLIRLPPVVHGEGSLGFVQLLLKSVPDSKQVVVVNEGKTRWPAVYTSDAASAYRLVLEKGTAGAVYHAVAEEQVLVRDVADAIGRKLGLPVVSKTVEETAELFGVLAGALGADNPVSSAWTREVLGWEPVGKGLIEDIEADLLDDAQLKMRM